MEVLTETYRNSIVNGRRAAPERLGAVAVVGLGYWGPNWIRNLHQLGCAHRVIACDIDAGRRERIVKSYPNTMLADDPELVLADPDVEAMIIATPVATHYEMARSALEAGKSVLVEKPLATSPEEAADLIEIARMHNRVLMVGHTFEYSAPVLKLQDIIASGELGEIFYITSTRANLGLFQRDVNVAWDLATHDISIILMLMGQVPEAVSCHGEGHYRRGIEDVALLTLSFPRGVIAFIHVSWLDPNKIRRTTVVGSRKMVVYDDTEPQEKVRIYDKGVSVQRYYDSCSELQYSYRHGDIQIPRVEETEPLRVECEHFVNCVMAGETPRTDGLSGLRVVSVLHAASLSLKNGGRMTPVNNPLSVKI